MRQILIISASLRNGSNSESLAEAFSQGATEAGHKVEVISLKGKKIAFCDGCLSCQKTGICKFNDDAREIAKEMADSDVIVFVSPVYYYSIAGQLKTMLDRANSLFVADYKFRDIYFLATAAEDEESTFVGPQKAIEGWIDCFPKAKLSGTVYAGGVTSPKEIEGHKSIYEAYKMAKEIA